MKRSGNQEAEGRLEQNIFEIWWGSKFLSGKNLRLFKTCFFLTKPCWKFSTVLSKWSLGSNSRLRRKRLRMSILKVLILKLMILWFHWNLTLLHQELLNEKQRKLNEKRHFNAKLCKIRKTCLLTHRCFIKDKAFDLKIRLLNDQGLRVKLIKFENEPRIIIVNSKDRRQSMSKS